MLVVRKSNLEELEGELGELSLCVVTGKNLCMFFEGGCCDK